MKRLQYVKKDFAWTKWTPTDIAAIAKTVIDRKRTAYATVKKIPAAQRTFENTVLAIEASDWGMEDYFKIALLMYVSPLADVRVAAQRAMELVGRKFVDFEYDESVYRALKEYVAKKDRLFGSDKKLLDDMLRDFRRRGFELSKAKRDRLKKNLKELSTLKNSFEKNLNDYQDSIEVSRAELAGLSERYVKGLPMRGGNYVVSLDYPSYIPFMEGAESEDRRRELSEKNFRKGGKRNLALLERIIALRGENAGILGYETHADFQTEDRMAGEADAVFVFLEKLMTPLAKRVKEDVDGLLVFKEEREGKRPRSLESHDVAYLATQQKKRAFGIDDEAIREYFPTDHIKDGLFALFGELFGVSYERIAWPLWHKDAELYAVHDRKSGERIAYFAFDLFPREGKYGHACMANVISGHETTEGYVTPFAVLITNFPKPSRNHPSLLSHDEVLTFFHEFGHLMHETLTEAKHLSQAGTNVSWDFVEAMSQMCEFFAWEETVLRRISKHYRTGTPLPRSLIRKLIASKRHMLAYDTQRQAVSALYDLMVHSGNLRGTLPEYFRSLTEAHLGVKIPKTSSFPSGFGHLAGGYDAGYYGYLWSRVYAADFFVKFREAGIISPKIGALYRKEILAKGSSEDELKIARAFLGRKLSNKAFLGDIGR